jgi:hypothetical protein
MRAFILAVTSIAALFSLPAFADHRDHGHGGFHPRSSISLSYGYPFGYYGGYGGFYRPYGYYSPYGFGSTFGVGVRVGERAAARRERTEQETSTQGTLKMYVYPAAGQTAEQTSEDRYQCHVWAADESDFDPTLGAGKRADAENYTRAFTACMEGRNYVVK